MRGVFVTGTSTGVGKTVVAAALTLGLEASYWKPVQCGLEDGGDRERVAAMTGVGEQRLPREAYRLQRPQSPHLAARAEGITIELARLTAPPVAGPLVAEGAGGLLVPLNWQATMLDLALQLRLPVVLVARTELGTINHTLLSLRALAAAGAEVAGVIFNGEEAEGLEETIARLGGARVLGRIPPLAELNPAALRGAFARLQGWR